VARHLAYMVKQKWVSVDRANAGKLTVPPEVEAAVFLELRRGIIIHADALMGGPKWAIEDA